MDRNCRPSPSTRSSDPETSGQRPDLPHANIGVPHTLRIGVSSLFAAGASFLLATGVMRGQALSALFARGFTVIPQPRQVKLEPNDFRFGNGWRLEFGAGVTNNSTAVLTLQEDLESRFGIVLKNEGSSPAVHLEIAPGSVHPGLAQDRDTEAIGAQAYRLELSPAAIQITGNAEAGLFYGIQTLVQLTKRSRGALWCQGRSESRPSRRRKRGPLRRAKRRLGWRTKPARSRSFSFFF
jgi:hypothetical protein